jgi:hypothetical protein
LGDVGGTLGPRSQATTPKFGAVIKARGAVVDAGWPRIFVPKDGPSNIWAMLLGRDSYTATVL